MPGVEPPDRDEIPGGANPRELATSIRDDFRALIATLEQEIGLVLDPDSEALRMLWRARTAAKLGLELSERLLKSIEDNADPR